MHNDDLTDLSRRLAQEAEAVCRHYLPKGRREGPYWRVGDIRGTPGRSLRVRLDGPDTGPGAIGRWVDQSTGQHGDLLDLIRGACRLILFRDVVEEARAFLNEPRPLPPPSAAQTMPPPRSRTESVEAAQRLIALSRPLQGTLAAGYLTGRGIPVHRNLDALRFHPRCYHLPADGGPRQIWPAMIAAVTDLQGRITGAHRTWLDPAGFHPDRLGKAPLDPTRKAMGALLGHAVRFGQCDDILATGEGIETVLSLRPILPGLPLAAALSSGHLSALILPPGLKRLYLLLDRDDAGDWATMTLKSRAEAAGIETHRLIPALGDFNEDLRRHGAGSLRDTLIPQLSPEDLRRFLTPAARLHPDGDEDINCHGTGGPGR